MQESLIFYLIYFILFRFIYFIPQMSLHSPQQHKRCTHNDSVSTLTELHLKQNAKLTGYYKNQNKLTPVIRQRLDPQLTYF